MFTEGMVVPNPVSLCHQPARRVAGAGLAARLRWQHGEQKPLPYPRPDVHPTAQAHPAFLRACDAPLQPWSRSGLVPSPQGPLALGKSIVTGNSPGPVLSMCFPQQISQFHRQDSVFLPNGVFLP